jgi:hypothetical protein
LPPTHRTGQGIVRRLAEGIDGITKFSKLTEFFGREKWAEDEPKNKAANLKSSRADHFHEL